MLLNQYVLIIYFNINLYYSLVRKNSKKKFSYDLKFTKQAPIIGKKLGKARFSELESSARLGSPCKKLGSARQKGGSDTTLVFTFLESLYIMRFDVADLKFESGRKLHFWDALPL